MSSTVAGHRGVTAGPLPGKANQGDTGLIIFAGFGVLCILIAVGILVSLSLRPESTPTQIVVDPATSPIQTELADGEVASFTWQRNGFSWTLIPRARYQMAARVLGNQAYQDWKTAIAPLDLAVAWGELSNPEVDQWIDWSQRDRALHYRWGGDSPYKAAVVIPNSANNHMIPATDNLATILGRVEANDVILLEGLLVDVAALRDGDTRGTLLSTSLSREDSGSRACEYFYIERLIIDGKEYR